MPSRFNGKNLLLDTNVLIYQLNGSLDLAEEFVRAKKLYISTLTVAELFAGAQQRDYQNLQDFLDEFTTLPISKQIATLAGVYKSTLPNRTLKDLIISATAEIHNLTLVSANEKDFVGINRLKPIFVKPNK
jgi:predicted nucleic acid-binding protein